MRHVPQTSMFIVQASATCDSKRVGLNFLIEDLGGQAIGEARMLLYNCVDNIAQT